MSTPVKTNGKTAIVDLFSQVIDVVIHPLTIVAGIGFAIGFFFF